MVLVVLCFWWWLTWWGFVFFVEFFFRVLVVYVIKWLWLQMLFQCCGRRFQFIKYFRQQRERYQFIVRRYKIVYFIFFDEVFYGGKVFGFSGVINSRQSKSKIWGFCMQRYKNRNVLLVRGWVINVCKECFRWEFGSFVFFWILVLNQKLLKIGFIEIVILEFLFLNRVFIFFMVLYFVNFYLVNCFNKSGCLIF